jgi:hypothetical protein
MADKKSNVDPNSKDARPLLPDKKRAPKATGRKGIGPAPVVDIKTKASGQKADKEEEQPVQGELIKAPEPPRGPAVQHGKIAMYFIGYKAKRAKNRDKLVNMDFSLELEPVHEKRLPREIEDAWKELERNKYSFVGPDGLSAQNLSLYLTADSDTPDLQVATTLVSAEIARIQERGEGSEKMITRLTMRFLTNLTKDVDQFCVAAFDEIVYAKMKASQRSFDDGADE